MTELINSNIYLIISAIIYLFLFIITIYLLSASFRNLTDKYILSKLTAHAVFNKVKNSFQLIFRYFEKFVNSEISAGVFLRKAENFFTDKLSPLLTGPVNILSLIIRKIFTENVTVILTMASVIIVAFYIILTVL